MKAILSLTICCLLSLVASSQENLKAFKVGEYQEQRSSFRDIDLHEKITSFVERLSAEPSASRGALVFTFRYKAITECLTTRVEPDRRILDFSRKILALHPYLSQDRLLFIEGEEELSFRSSVEFWIVPKGAPVPKAPDLDFDPPCSCAPLDIYGVPRVKKGISTVKFIASLGGSFESLSCVKYNWVVTGGKVTNGQGTNQITVDVLDNPNGHITATVEIDGADPSCNCVTTASYTTKIGDAYLPN